MNGAAFSAFVIFGINPIIAYGHIGYFPTAYIKEMIPFEHQLNQTFAMNTLVYSVACIFIRNAFKSIIVRGACCAISGNTGTGPYLIYILNRFITLAASAQCFSISQIHISQTKQSRTMSVGTATSLFRSHFTHTIACVGSIPIGMSITGITVKRQFCSYFLTRSICLQPSRTIECNVCIKTRFAISPLFQSLIRIALEIGSGGNYFVIIVIRPSQIFIGRHTLIFFIILVVNNPSAIFHKVQVYHFLGYTKSETASQSTAIIIVAFM